LEEIIHKKEYNSNNNIFRKIGGYFMAKSITTTTIYSTRIAVLVFAIVAYFYIPGLQEFIAVGKGYLQQRDFEGLRQFILAYGLWAPIVSIVLMFAQSLLPVVPGIVITITNAWIFGWQYGALYSWIGALLGAMLDFGMARWYGRVVVEKIVNSKYLDMINNFLHRYGIVAIFITRLTPIIPFKMISFSAGLTTMSLWRFVLATAIGQAPAIILYSILCNNLTHSIRIVAALVSLFITTGVLMYYYREEITVRFFADKK
jgi:uncharacterized membrane protein YdjX (TVP38/TMEM64 family)